MNSRPPVKNTSGEGFDVETHVVAWFSCHILAGVPWAAADLGQIESLECQMQQDGWKFDDIVVNVSKGVRQFRIGCSVKSFPVFGARGAPKGFRESIWKEWMSDSSPFKKDEDLLALICSPHETKIQRTWSGLLESAKKMSCHTLAERFKIECDPSRSRSEAFSSLRCPSDLNAEFYDTRAETARLLARLTLVELDFENTGSRDIEVAVMLCQQCLEDSERRQASDLWAEIIAISGRYRKKGGKIDLPILLRELCGEFPLKNHPSFSKDWRLIEDFSQEYLSTIPRQIGGELEIERTKLLTKVEDLTTKSDYAVAIGRTGNGKSVLSRTWALSDAKSCSVWISHEQLNVDGGIRALWGISETWSRLIEHSVKPLRIVIDGIDRCFTESAFSQLAQIFNATCSSVNEHKVKFLITCTPEEWHRVEAQVIRHGCSQNFMPCVVPGFGNSEIDLVQAKFPKLEVLFQRPHLQSMLRWPKILDMLTLHGIENEMSSWTTEPEFVKSFWSSAIQKDDPFSNRGEVLQKLGVEISLNGGRAVGIGIFNSDEKTALKELGAEKHLIIDKHKATISFNHELLGDFSRLRFLESNGEVNSVVLKHVENPTWDRAIRLYGLDLMEQDSSSKWLAFFESFDSSTPSGIRVQNLLLEAPIFAVQPSMALEQIWPVLRERKGLLIKRFIRQFLMVASTPDPRFVAIFNDDGEQQALAETRYRLPHGPYWPSLLSFLLSHKDELIEFVPEEIADVCLMWLPLSNFVNYGMEDASRLAVDLASDYVEKDKYSYSDNDEVSVCQKICEAFMLAASTLPEEVAGLALTLAGRKQATEEEEDDSCDQDNLKHLIKVRGKTIPWDEGPKSEPANDFSKAFLSGNNIGLFCKHLPAVAEEVMFALLLDIPREYDSPDSYDLDQKGFNDRDWTFTDLFWSKGPFITFLRASPLEAVSAIVRLVNFATDRSKDLKSSCRQIFDLELDFGVGLKKWEGHEYSALWYRGHVFGPKSVCCALMALEKWFYECADNRIDLIDEAIEIVLKNGRSIALLFVLISIAKKNPDLFLGQLRPILESPEIHFWDNHAITESNMGGLATPPFLASEQTYNMYADWFHLKHRKEALPTLVARMSRCDEKWESIPDDLSTLWKKVALKNKELVNGVDGLLLWLKHENYTIEGDGSQATWNFQNPSIQQPSKSDSETESFQDLIDEMIRMPHLILIILNGNDSCDEEQMEIYWNKLEGYLALKVSQDESERFTKWSAILGILAVAVVHHREWLKSSEERDKRVFEILNSVIDSPPVVGWYGAKQEETHHWDNFLVWIISTLWKENRKDSFLREAIIRLASSGRSIVTEELFERLSHDETLLGTDFESLLNSSVRMAQLKYIRMVERHTQVTESDWQEQVDTIFNSFIQGTSVSIPDHWVQLCDEVAGRYWSGGMSNSFDISLLSSVVKWASDFTNIEFNAERKKRVYLNAQLANCTVYRMQTWLRMKEESGREDFADHGRKMPYVDESEVFEQVAKALVQLEPSDEPELLWEPFFKLGNIAPYWIDRFLSGWFSEIRQMDPIPARISYQWKQMLEFSKTSPEWEETHQYNRGLSEAREQLYGFGQLGDYNWEVNLLPIVREIEPYLKDWLIPRLKSSILFPRIISILKKEGARELRLESVSWIKEQFFIQEEKFWLNKARQDVLASYLSFLWINHNADISKSDSAKEAIRSLSLKLSSLQHPLGTEIHRKVGHL